MILYLLLLLQSAAPLKAHEDHDPPSLMAFEDLQDLNIEFPRSTCNIAQPRLTQALLPTYLGCCPATGSVCEDHLNGQCYPWWVIWRFPIQCDYIINNLCTHPGCKCCIRCNESPPTQCSENNGVCSTRCKRKQFEANYLECESCLCKCCQECDQTDQCSSGDDKKRPGKCVGDENSCGSGHYITQDCNPGQPCHCCRKCKEKEECRKLGGYCERRGLGCEEGYVEHECGCEPGNDCVCCIPKDALECTQGPGCSDGYCTTDSCPRGYQTTEDCVGTHSACHCCKPLVSDDALFQDPSPVQVSQVQTVSITLKRQKTSSKKEELENGNEITP